MVKLDISKAFDTIWLDGLRYKLHRYGVRGRMLHWLSSFIAHRAYRVITPDTTEYVEFLEAYHKVQYSAHYSLLSSSQTLHRSSIPHTLSTPMTSRLHTAQPPLRPLSRTSPTTSTCSPHGPLTGSSHPSPLSAPSHSSLVTHLRWLTALISFASWASPSPTNPILAFSVSSSNLL